MDETSLEALGAAIGEALPQAVSGFAVARGELTVEVKAPGWVEVARTLRDDPRFAFVAFTDLCGVDYPGREQRFDVVLHLLSPKFVRRVRVKTRTDEATPIASLVDLFPAANWFEREAYDLYGILFTGHPDLRRILTDYGFDGHPLRKDFPLTGHVEVRWDDGQKRVITEPVKLTQEFRQFDFVSPWEGTDYHLPGDEKAAR